VDPEPELVDDPVREQAPRELAAADRQELTVELALQAGHRLAEIALEERGVPRERLAERPRRDVLG
jgi:hypothetical protein